MISKNKKHTHPLAQAQESEAREMAEGSQKQGAFDRALLSWLAPRFLRYPRSTSWFVGVFGISGLLAWYAVLTEAWTMLVVFIILPMVLVLEHRHKPENVRVVISEYGIGYGAVQVPYSQIKCFWIGHHPPMVDELHLVVNSRWMPEVVIPLMGNDPALIRQFMVTQAPEWEGKKLSMMDVLIRLLRLN